jgi:peptidoglycan-associated lipoprotein
MNFFIKPNKCNSLLVAISLLMIGIFFGGCYPERKSTTTHIRLEEKNRAKARKQSASEMLHSGIIPPIEFDFDKYELLPESIETLDKVAEVLLENPRVRLILEGHCDDVGSNEYNDWLSLMRTSAVKEYLVEKGILPTSIKVLGFGKRDRKTMETTWRARGLNRRVELTFTDRNWESVF